MRCRQHQTSSSSLSELGIDLERASGAGRDVDIDSRLRVAASRGRLSTYGSRRFPMLLPTSPSTWFHRQSSVSASAVARWSNVRRRRAAPPPPPWWSLSRRPSSRCLAAASQSSGKLRRDAGLDRTSSSSSSSDSELDDDENDGGVGEPARRGKLMLPGMRCSSGTVGDGRTRGMLMTLFLRRTRRDCDRFNAVGGFRTGAGSCGNVTGMSLSTDGCCTGGASSALGVEDWSGETPAVGEAVARGIDGARR